MFVLEIVGAMRLTLLQSAMMRSKQNPLANLARSLLEKATERC